MESRRGRPATRWRWRRCSIHAGSQRSPGSWPIPPAAGFAASTRASSAGCRFHPPAHPSGSSSPGAAHVVSPPTNSSPMSLSSNSPTGARWPRILSEHLVPVAEPLAVALEPAGEAPPRSVVAAAARALLDSTPAAPVAWPPWLAPHQIPAADRLTAIIARHGGALLADEVGLGKSYIALAVALARKEPFALVVPAILLPQWRSLLGRFGVHDAPIITHEFLSNRPVSLPPVPPVPPVGVPSLRAAAQRDDDTSLANAAVARLIVARSRARVQSGYNGGPVTLSFPRSSGESIRVGTASDAMLIDLIGGVARLRAGGSAAPLLRLMLLRRLGSSMPAFRAALLRYDAYLDLATRATAEGRTLTAPRVPALLSASC